MKRPKKQCDLCLRLITDNNFNRHRTVCNGQGLKSDRRKAQKLIDEQQSFKCLRCDNNYPSRLSLSGHKRFCDRPWSDLGKRSRREALLKEAEFRCSQCSFDKTRKDGVTILEIDHIDGNPKNNSRENLRVLCPNCHALTENFRNWGNKGNVKRSPRVRKENKISMPD